MPQQALFLWNIYVVLKKFPGLPVQVLLPPFKASDVPIRPVQLSLSMLPSVLQLGTPVSVLVLCTPQTPGVLLVALLTALMVIHEAWLAPVLCRTPMVSLSPKALKRRHLALLPLMKNVGLTALTRARAAASNGVLTVLIYGLRGSPDPVMLTENGLVFVVVPPLPIGMQQQN